MFPEIVVKTQGNVDAVTDVEDTAVVLKE